VRFAAPRGPPALPRGRSNAFDGKQYAAMAETRAARCARQALSQTAWTIAYASSEEARKEDGGALNAINGQATDYWHTAYSGAR
jgi:beta-galactosidase